MKGDSFTIIGGGVIGLSIAYQLLKQQQHVTIFHAEKTTTASLAAGGMLGGQNEFYAPSPLYDLAIESRSLHKKIAQELFELTGQDVGLLPSGLIKIAANEQGLQDLQQQYDFLHKDRPASIRWLNQSDLQQAEPLLGQAVAQGFHIYEDHQVNARALTKALFLAVQQLGATIIDEEVVAIEKEQQQITYVQTTCARYAVAQVVLAAGAWTTKLATTLNITCPMHPVKGECLMLKADQLPKATIFSTDGCYIVPKQQRFILIGATSYPLQDDDAVTAGGIHSLLTRAFHILPSLTRAEIIETWCGVRPQTIDGLPIMGDTQYSNLFLCTGHYRNGILLSAITGLLFSQALLGDNTAKQRLAPFALQRFTI
ncbi:glycine oxidase ThiO [Metasolibacillus meyeri]|uniref:glycine oxidase ThiO n=1 Tax=Metasolibacillus meyeri TaxID=1071052 RepID=UPI000D323384|nr:glycine oxidase ThiO [Metasolibacillus meyeri]